MIHNHIRQLEAEITRLRADNERLRDLLGTQTIWVEGCLQSYTWDGDQYEAAQWTCTEAHKLLAATEPKP